MNIDKIYRELVDEVGILPVICNEGLEHSDSWVEIKSKSGEEKVIVCPECGQEIIQEFMERKGKAHEKLIQNLLEDLIKKNQIK